MELKMRSTLWCSEAPLKSGPVPFRDLCLRRLAQSGNGTIQLHGGGYGTTSLVSVAICGMGAWRWKLAQRFQEVHYVESFYITLILSYMWTRRSQRRCWQRRKMRGDKLWRDISKLGGKKEKKIRKKKKLKKNAYWSLLPLAFLF